MSLGSPEIAVIFILILVLFGPNRLPELARGIGKGLREFKKATEDIQRQLSSLTEIEPTPTVNNNSPSNAVAARAAEIQQATDTRALDSLLERDIQHDAASEAPIAKREHETA